MTTIFVDADACPVKPEVCRVAVRFDLEVVFVANTSMRIPDQGSTSLVVVGNRLDEADDWIAEHAGKGDVVVTADVPLASRCLAVGAHVLGNTGKPFTTANIGSALATRDLLADLRGGGEMMGGPPPFQKKDRSRFLQNLHQVIDDLMRECRISDAP